MTAVCWGCHERLGGVPGLSLPRDPLGSCWECGVFGCDAHADKDRDSGKWLCLETVADALGRSAGLDLERALPEELRFGDVEDYQQRLPVIFRSVREEAETGLVQRQLAEEAAHRWDVRDRSLLTEAILLGALLVRPRLEESKRGVDIEGVERPWPLRGTLSMVLDDLWPR